MWGIFSEAADKVKSGVSGIIFGNTSAAQPSGTAPTTKSSSTQPDDGQTATKVIAAADDTPSNSVPASGDTTPKSGKFDPDVDSVVVNYFESSVHIKNPTSRTKKTEAPKAQEKIQETAAYDDPDTPVLVEPADVPSRSTPQTNIGDIVEELIKLCSESERKLDSEKLKALQEKIDTLLRVSLTPKLGLQLEEYRQLRQLPNKDRLIDIFTSTFKSAIETRKPKKPLRTKESLRIDTGAESDLRLGRVQQQRLLKHMDLSDNHEHFTPKLLEEIRQLFDEAKPRLMGVLHDHPDLPRLLFLLTLPLRRLLQELEGKGKLLQLLQCPPKSPTQAAKPNDTKPSMVQGLQKMGQPMVQKMVVDELQELKKQRELENFKLREAQKTAAPASAAQNQEPLKTTAQEKPLLKGEATELASTQVLETERLALEAAETARKAQEQEKALKLKQEEAARLAKTQALEAEHQKQQAQALEAAAARARPAQETAQVQERKPELTVARTFLPSKQTVTTPPRPCAAQETRETEAAFRSRMRNQYGF